MCRLSPLALLSLFLLATRLLVAEIPLAHHAPQLALHTPPLYPIDYAAADARQAFSAGVWCALDGTLTRIDLEALPEELTRAVEHSLRTSVFRPAHTFEAPTDGFRRVLFRSYFTPVRGAPTPTPQLHFDEAARQKLENIARTVVRGWLRVRLSIDDQGRIQRVETQNRPLDAALRTLFANDIDLGEPPFAPAAVDGRRVGGQLDLFWDLTPPQDRNDYRDVVTELVQMGANAWPTDLEPPDENRRFRGWIQPHASNRVTSAYVDQDAPPALRQAFLHMAARWFIPDRNADRTLEVALRYEAEDALLVVESFRPVEVTPPALRFSARPIYPRRRLMPNPTGFVRVQMTVGVDGRPADIMLLEASSNRFRAPALEALDVWHFTPMKFDGEPIPARVFWTIPFDPSVQ